MRAYIYTGVVVIKAVRRTFVTFIPISTFKAFLVTVPADSGSVGKKVRICALRTVCALILVKEIRIRVSAV